MRQLESYEVAIAQLANQDDETPEKTVVLTRLGEHPEQVYSTFDGCLAGEGTAVLEARRRSALYEYIPDAAAATEVYPLTESTTLVMIPCELGPYWVATAHYIWDEAPEGAEVRSLIFPTYRADPGEVVSTDSNITAGFQTYNEETGELSWSYKHAGHGGCGCNSICVLADGELTLTQRSEHNTA